MRMIRKRTENRGVPATQRTDEQRLRRYAELRSEVLYAELESNPSGLTAAEAEAKRDIYGPNEISAGHKSTRWQRLGEAILNPFNIILLVIAVVTYVTDVVLAEQADYLTVLIILGLVLISSGVAFVQAERSHTATESLSKLVSNTVDVLRGSKQETLSMEDIVPGDVVRLSAGDMLPADVIFTQTKDTFVAQAALTGESNPVEKFSASTDDPASALTDLQNVGFMGSNIISGSATALVVATGEQTYFGSMAQLLSGDRAKSSFERGVEAVSKLLVRMMLVMVPVVFLINGIFKSDWSGALLFAISIAVGLTPEMLPVIMTSTLARGAVTMSKHKVIVRTLGSIQTFGEMDVLCTDKTGTLTEDEIVLERYMDVYGHDDARILRHAYLNSYFQTGLKNLIDHAIIQRADKEGLTAHFDRYERVDEIPFDFVRRRMSVVLEDESGKRQLITKGAVEEILDIVSWIELNGQVLPLDEETRRQAMQTYEHYNHDGLRMLAVAQKNDVPGSGSFSVEDEAAMVLIGFVGFLDPPKESAAEAITALKDHGVRTVVLTGDSEGVAIKVCGKVGVSTEQVLTGRDVEAMSEAELEQAVQSCDLFAKLSPKQKERVVRAFQSVGHTVGYMGDGINDAPALRQADVGISVDSGVDIAKETADIILLEKDLMVLENGVIQGRKTFGNIMKYIKMATSGNFGNMISVIVASIFLPFLPMLPVQILAQNLLCDLAQIGIPYDRVDQSYLDKPRKWETNSIKTFMFAMGPLSSVFDILCFAVLWWIIGANFLGMAPLFQGGWFVFGTVSQILIIHIIRTGQIPFVQSRASKPLVISSILIAVIALVVGFTNSAIGLDMLPLPLNYLPWLALLLLGYAAASQWIKRLYIKRYGEWL